MRGSINALTAEIPAVEGDLCFAFFINHIYWVDLDAVRCIVFFEWFALEGIHEAGFADFAFANEDELGFVEDDLLFGFGAQVCHDGIKAFFVCCGEFGVGGVVFEVE